MYLLLILLGVTQAPAGVLFDLRHEVHVDLGRRQIRVTGEPLVRAYVNASQYEVTAKRMTQDVDRTARGWRASGRCGDAP